jgi:hypothetical protein
LAIKRNPTSVPLSLIINNNNIKVYREKGKAGFLPYIKKLLFSSKTMGQRDRDTVFL